MKSFKELILEMGYNNGIASTENRSEEFKSLLTNFHMKLVKDGINSEHYKLYRYGKGTFYLTDENNRYLGFIEGSYKDNLLIITLTNSQIKGNFYNLMFTSILALTEVEYIFSDLSLSPSSVKAYKKLNANSALKVKMSLSISTNISNFEELDIEKLFDDNSYRIVVYEKNKGHLGERFSSLTIPIIHSYYVKRDKSINNRLYCESEVL